MGFPLKEGATHAYPSLQEVTRLITLSDNVLGFLRLLKNHLKLPILSLPTDPASLLQHLGPVHQPGPSTATTFS